MLRPHEQPGVHVLAWNILDRRVARLAKSQCFPRISDDASRDRNDDAMRIALDRNRMIRPRDLDGLRFPFGKFQHGFTPSISRPVCCFERPAAVSGRAGDFVSFDLGWACHLPLSRHAIGGCRGSAGGLSAVGGKNLAGHE